MADFDVDLIVKLLGLTTSDQDGEALAAIRKVNELLKANELTWREFVSRYTPFYQSPAPADYPRYQHDYRYNQNPFYDDAQRAQNEYAEEHRRRGEQARAERERRQAERDQYKPGGVNPKSQPSYEEKESWDWMSSADNLDDERAKLGLRWQLVEAGCSEEETENFFIVYASHPDVAEWVLHHRNDNPLVVMTWQAITRYPLQLGPLHVSIIRKMMRRTG